MLTKEQHEALVNDVHLKWDLVAEAVYDQGSDQTKTALMLIRGEYAEMKKEIEELKLQKSS